MNWLDTLKAIAPTIAAALGGPLAGAAVAAIGNAIGLPSSTQESIAKAFSDGQLTSDHIAEIRRLELQYQNEEKERGFRYADLEFKDRDSARRANVDGGTQRHLFWLSIILLIISLGSEVAVLFLGYPTVVPDIVVGRVLGLLDSVTLMVLAYWYGTSNGSAIKTGLMANDKK